MIEGALIISPILLMLAYPMYVLMMAIVLRIVGVERRQIAKWALRQADRQPLIDLIRAVRGVQPEAEQQSVSSSSTTWKLLDAQ